MALSKEEIFTELMYRHQFKKDLKRMLRKLLNTKIDINISFQEVVKFNSKYKDYLNDK